MYKDKEKEKLWRERWTKEHSEELVKYRKEWRNKNGYRVGKNAVNYIHGQGYGKYSILFNDKLKEKIRKRDNYTCQNCGITEEEHIIVFGEVLSVHHIDYDKQNCLDHNLITACRNCNTRANFNIEYWKNFYTNKIKEVIKSE
jgi:5-methylcytosine-specific restriction endonuclease McrA